MAKPVRRGYSTANEKLVWLRERPWLWEGFDGNHNQILRILNAMMNAGLYSKRTPIGDALGRVFRCVSRLREERRLKFYRENTGKEWKKPNE